MQGGKIDSFFQRLFYNQGAAVPYRLREVLQRCSHLVQWYEMYTRNARYQGFLAVCAECGVTVMASWTPSSTPGWKDHQRANMCTFFGVDDFPAEWRRPLEQTIPMV